MMNKQFVMGEVKSTSRKAREVAGYASTGDTDRDNESIRPAAWFGGLGNFRRNPVLMWGHNYQIPPIGKVLEVKPDGRGLKFRAKFAKSKFAAEIFDLYDDGILSAFSVGFRPLEWADPNSEERARGVERVCSSAELLEVSCVPIPANASALVERGLVATVAVKRVRDFQRNPMSKAEQNEVWSVYRDPGRQLFAMLRLLIDEKIQETLAEYRRAGYRIGR